MRREVFTFIVGGKAGQGVRKAGTVASQLFLEMGRNSFQMDDYPSLIKGGHNFSVVSTSTDEVTSQHMKADLVVALDSKSYEIHRNHLKENGTMACDSAVKEEGVISLPISSEAKKYPNRELISGLSSIAILAATIGMEKEELVDLIKKQYKREVENNVSYASTIYDAAYQEIGGKFSLEKGKSKGVLLTGNEAIALGAAAGGLDIYFAYPMTPSTSILHYLARHSEDLGIVAVHPENEIAVAQMATGATFAGAKAMVASSGGGFSLMQETFSLAGMSEAPVLFVLGSRPGPSTGVPTYTEQGDLKYSIRQGQGEFPRIVSSPGTVEEAFYLASEMLELVWKFQTPGVLLTEKHMEEGRKNVDLDVSKAKWAEPLLHKKGEFKRYLDTSDGMSPLLFPPSEELIKWNSYEHDELGITTEEPEKIVGMHNKRIKKHEALVKHMKSIHTVNVFGNKGPAIFTYGSTTMSVLEALRHGNIDATVVQPRYVEPLPVWELERYKDKKCIVVEQSSIGQFASLLKENVGIKAQKVIKKYDGRPFDPIELAEEIKEVV
ncbi:MAG TPA: 2-oxoacid:acceptor oxidoreductase subunit alpha [Thermoplasmata archaeon]|nr:2-oxoacid:acceptor oxidoreductase subunit alpha [Thermoplasmata archaeon]